MHVTLVGPEVEENLSLRSLAACLGQVGFSSEIHPFNADPDFPRIVQAILAAQPLVVGLSLAFQWRARDFLALAMALREGGYRGHITTGGHFATFTAAEILRDFTEIDSVCLFEAERTLVDLVRTVAEGRSLASVDGLAFRDSDGVRFTAPRPFPDLASLPHPDRRGEPAVCFGHRIAPLIGSRGCYGNCAFCCIAAWHEKTLPGKRFRLRDIEDIADEMVHEQRSRGIEIFVFQDDNFFLPRPADSIARIEALASALERRGMGRFATVVKARSNDVRPDVFRVLVDRLHTLRVYVGIETDADQGLRTLNRRSTRSDNHQALHVVRDLNLYICFNLLCFDPDTTLDHLDQNIRFMEEVADWPFCIGRVELYAGTPLLERMQREGRCRGDWLQWDYDLTDSSIERVFRMTMQVLRARNFGDASPVVQLWLLRFDIEAARFFHPEIFDPAWLDQGIAITRVLSLDTVRVMRALVDRVRQGAPPSEDSNFARSLVPASRALDQSVISMSTDLAARMGRAVGYNASLTEVRRVLVTRSQEIP